LNLISVVPLQSNSCGATRPTGRWRSSCTTAPWPARWPCRTEGLHALRCEVVRDLRLKTKRGSRRVLPKLKLDGSSCLREVSTVTSSSRNLMVRHSFSRAPPVVWLAWTGATRPPLPRPWLQSFQKAAKDRAQRPLGFGEFLWIADENWIKSGRYL
jgi:hypothetical protein